VVGGGRKGKKKNEDAQEEEHLAARNFRTGINIFQIRFSIHPTFRKEGGERGEKKKKATRGTRHRGGKFGMPIYFYGRKEFRVPSRGKKQIEKAPLLSFVPLRGMMVREREARYPLEKEGSPHSRLSLPSFPFSEKQEKKGGEGN